VKGPRPVPLADRLWAKVDKTPTCWLWTGAVNNMGYGYLMRGGSDHRKVLAHRAAYELLVGPVPDGMDLDHVKARGCMSTRCVNPAHLEPVTHRVNLQRGRLSYAVRTVCANGHDITDPANVYTTPAGKHQCRPCRRAVDARRRSPAPRLVVPTG
jgi:hypothetical protein